MTARSSTLYLACSLAFGVSAFCATGCSSSSSGSPNPAQPGDDGSTPSDGGVTPEDATVSTDDGPGGGDDSSSPHDGGPGPTEASTSNPVAAGDAGAAQFCSAVCAGLVACAADAGVDGGPCHCSAGSASIERTDYVQAFTSCVKGAIVASCSDTAGAVQGCEVRAAASINPTAAAANFCKDLEFTRCSTILPDCLTNAGVYSDTTIAAFANCFPDLPDAAVDGGCTSFGNCLNTASTP